MFLHTQDSGNESVDDDGELTSGSTRVGHREADSEDTGGGGGFGGIVIGSVEVCC